MATFSRARKHIDEILHHPSLALGIIILSVITIAAIFAEYMFTVDPRQLAPVNRLQGPSGDFWFGTDMLGRDLYSRVVYGARVSLVVGISVAVLSVLRACR